MTAVRFTVLLVCAVRILREFLTRLLLLINLIIYIGGYAEALCVQQNRKDQGEKMKIWAEAAWKNRRLSLAEALEISEPSPKTMVIDARISRVL